jgi:hypothetical protein
VGRIRIFDSRSAGWKGVIVGAICVCVASFELRCLLT